MDFWKENRLVFMAAGEQPEPATTPDPVEAQEQGTETAEDPEKEKDLAVAEKKADLKVKVESAQEVVDQLKAIYGEANEQGIDKNAGNDKEVDQRADKISSALTDMTDAFNKGVESLEDEYEAALTELEEDIYADIAGVLEIGDVSGDTLKEEAKKDMADAAKVTVEEADTAIGQLEEARKLDDEARASATEKITSSEDLLAGFQLAYPEKDIASVQKLVDDFKADFEANYAGDDKDIDPAALNTATGEFSHALDLAVVALAGEPLDAINLKIEEVRAEEELPISPYLGERMQALIGENPQSSVVVEGAQVFDEADMERHSISEGGADDANIETSVVEVDGEAQLVQNYENFTVRQEYGSLADFKKNFPSIDLPDSGDGPFGPFEEDIYMSESRPRPFKGIRRKRDISVSVERDDQGAITKVKVTASNVRFGNPPESTVHIRLGKSPAECTEPADLLYPPGYNPRESRNFSSESTEAAVEANETDAEKLARYKQELPEYVQALSEMTPIKPGDPRLAELPKFLQKSIFAYSTKPELARHMKRASELMKAEPVDMESLTEVMQDLEGKALQMKAKPDSDLSNLPEFQKFEKIKKEGLAYPEANINAFRTDFGDAATHLENHFFDQGAMNEGEGSDVSLASANLSFYGSGVGKQVSGSFEIKVKGCEGMDSIKFKFRRMGATDKGLTWESAVLNAMKKVTSNKDINKAVQEQRKQRNKIERTHRAVDQKEVSTLEKRLKAKQKAAKNGEEFDPFKYEDYRAKKIDDVKKKISEDHGNPKEYRYATRGEHWVAIRVTERGLGSSPSGKFGEAAGLVAPVADETAPPPADAVAQVEAVDESPDYRAVVAEGIVAGLNQKTLPSGELMIIGVALDDPGKLDIDVGSRHLFLTVTPAPTGEKPNLLKYSFTDDSGTELHAFHDNYDSSATNNLSRVCAIVQSALASPKTHVATEEPAQPEASE